MSVAKHPILVIIILYVITLKEVINVLARLVTLGRLTSVLVRNFSTLLVRKKEDLFCHEILSPRIKFSCLVTRSISYYLPRKEVRITLLCRKTKPYCCRAHRQRPRQMVESLRTAPTFVSAHSFCASFKTWFNRHACARVGACALTMDSIHASTRLK